MPVSAYLALTTALIAFCALAALAGLRRKARRLEERMMSKVRYQEVQTYGSGGETVQYIKASVQFGMYDFAGKGRTAEDAKIALCREIEGYITDLRHAITAVEAETPSAVEPAD